MSAGDDFWGQTTQPPTGLVLQEPRVAPRRAYLVGLSADAVGLVYDLKSVTVIGRQESADIVLSDTSISRKHAQVVMTEDGEALIKDLDSSNGTFVNDHPIREARLREGDRVRVGTATLKFTWGDELAETFRRNYADAAERLNLTHAELKQAQERLVQVEKQAALGRLAAGVGHEVINPLSFVIHNLDFLSRELGQLGPNPPGASSEVQEAIRDARDGAERVRLIVSDLQDFARHAHEKKSPLDIHPVLDAAIKMASERIKPHARLLKTYGKVPRVEANEARLVQVFTNLLVNASHAVSGGNPAEDFVRVGTLTGPDGQLIVDIEDTGVGIPEENLRRIFDPFFTTKPVGVGTGLGLAICQAILTSHQGELTVRSVPGKGSVFRVVLPSYEEPSVETEVAGVTSTLSGNFLAVERDDETLGVLRQALGEGAVLQVVGSGQEALSLVRGGASFQLILCNVDLPELSAVNFCRELRGRDPAQFARVVLLTGQGTSNEARAALAQLPNPRLTKPLEPRLLRSAIERWLNLWAD